MTKSTSSAVSTNISSTSTSTSPSTSTTSTSTSRGQSSTPFVLMPVRSRSALYADQTYIMDSDFFNDCELNHRQMHKVMSSTHQIDWSASLSKSSNNGKSRRY